MATSIIVEVLPGSGGELPIDLLTAVHRASEAIDVILVLRGTTAAAVETLLMPAAQSRRGAGGVQYLSATDGAAIAMAAQTARFAICATDQFRVFMARSGVHCLNPAAVAEGLRVAATPGVAVAGGYASPFRVLEPLQPRVHS